MFSDSAGGFSVPLVASGEMFGVLNVEYPPPYDLSEDDEPVAIPLANQLSVALRNLNLLGEARYYRDYLRKMIDVANALIIVIDRDANVAVMNKTMQSYLGFGPEVIGTPLEEIRKRSTAPEPRLSTLLLAGLRGIEYSDCEVPLWRRKAETLGRGMFNTSVLRAPDGSIDGVIAIGNDVERMRSLERQVIQAEKLATLGQLAAGVVHELNNPLTSISVYGDYLVRLLERGGERGGDLDKANKIVEGAGRIQKLTRDLMSYARPSGEYEWVLVNDVVRQALDLLRARGAARRGRGPAAARRRAAARARHPRAAPPGAHQPHHQRPPRAARGGRARHHRQRARRRRARGAGARVGQRRGHRVGRPGARVRALLHDEERWQGNRTRVIDREEHRRRARRAGALRERGGRWGPRSSSRCRFRRRPSQYENRRAACASWKA